MHIKHVLGALVTGALINIGGVAVADDDYKDTRTVEKNEVTAKNDDSKYQKLEERIETRLSKDKGLKEHRIDVDIHDGKVVLKGEVDSKAERLRAGRHAKRAGAKQLDNQLTVDDNDGFFGVKEKEVDKDADRAAKKADRKSEDVENEVERGDGDRPFDGK